MELVGISFSLFFRYTRPQGGISREIPHQDLALAAERGAFDPKPLVLTENCLLAQPEAYQGKQGVVSWSEKQAVQSRPSLRHPLQLRECPGAPLAVAGAKPSQWVNFWCTSSCPSR